jgi:ribonuclease VapC
MVLDTSVLLHVFFEEPGWETSVAYLMRQETRLVSAASLVEAQAVIAGRTAADPMELLDVLVRDLGLEIAALTAAQADIARRAYCRFGKGQGHPARLNYGDVMSYALATDRRERLAFVGDDFHHTDVDVVRLPVGGDASSPR